MVIGQHGRSNDRGTMHGQLSGKMHYADVESKLFAEFM